MTKIISLTPATKDFGAKGLMTENPETFIIENTGTEKVAVSDIVSNNPNFITDFTAETIQPAFPISSTIYFNDKGLCQDLSTGAFYTTNQGYGVLGTTDANGVLTVNTLVPAVSITAPSASAEYEIGDTVTVTWTSSNIANLDLVVESATGILTVEDIDASLGTYDITLTAETGTFNANQDITISLTDCIGVATDSVDIVSIATSSPTYFTDESGNQFVDESANNFITGE